MCFARAALVRLHFNNYFFYVISKSISTALRWFTVIRWIRTGTASRVDRWMILTDWASTTQTVTQKSYINSSVTRITQMFFVRGRSITKRSTLGAPNAVRCTRPRRPFGSVKTKKQQRRKKIKIIIIIVDEWTVERNKTRQECFGSGLLLLG